MIESVQFKNFKVLRDTTLPLSPLTLIVGPNGSGKSTALQALACLEKPKQLRFDRAATAGAHATDKLVVEVIVRWAAPHAGVISRVRWTSARVDGPIHEAPEGKTLADSALQKALEARLGAVRVYSLNAKMIAQPVGLAPNIELREDGAQLAGALDRVRDQDPERFEALADELSRWLPEFDRVLFDTPSGGQRSVLLRTRKGRHAIRAEDLSQGTLLALALLTVAYMPDPPPIVCLEEPDRGIHPRLLRDVRDAMYRLSHPENFGEVRDPVQVIATTHSPYLVDLYRDHPEEIVIAHKEGLEARFERLSDRPDADEILQDAQLGEAWYSGVLGGVPTER